MVPAVPGGFNCEPILDKQQPQPNFLVGAFEADAACELTLKNIARQPKKQTEQL
jgi:hypothetical protein